MNFFFVDFLFNIKTKNGDLERYFGDYSNAGCKWTGHYDVLQMDQASRIVFVGHFLQCQKCSRNVKSIS